MFKKIWNFIKKVFTGTVSWVKLATNQVKALVKEYGDLFEFAVLIVKEIEEVSSDEDGKKKAELAFKRIMEKAEELGYEPKTRLVNWMIEMAVILLKGA